MHSQRLVRALRWVLMPAFAYLLSSVFTNAFAADSTRYTIDIAGTQRSYLVHMPATTGAGPLPVVLVLHGGGGSGEQVEKASGMDETADRHGFVAVYPNGSSGRRRDILLTWNAGNCCGYALENNVDDVAFIAAVLDDLPRRANVDMRRIYATGMSNGGMMAHRIGDELSDRIAAIAPVAGAHLPAANAKGRAMPVLHIHSVDDPRAHYEGGLRLPGLFDNAKGEHPPVEATIAGWVKKNGCKAEPALLEQRSADGHTASRYVYGGCRDGAEVDFWKLTGAGHVWPGEKKSFGRKAEQTTRVINANEEVWRFVSRFSLPDARPLSAMPNPAGVAPSRAI